MLLESVSQCERAELINCQSCNNNLGLLPNTRSSPGAYSAATYMCDLMCSGNRLMERMHAASRFSNQILKFSSESDKQIAALDRPTCKTVTGSRRCCHFQVTNVDTVTQCAPNGPAKNSMRAVLHSMLTAYLQGNACNTQHEFCYCRSCLLHFLLAALLGHNRFCHWCQAFHC